MRMNWATCEPRPSWPHLQHLLRFFLPLRQPPAEKTTPLPASIRHPIKKAKANPAPSHQIPSTCLDLGSGVNSHSSDDEYHRLSPTEAMCPKAAQALLTCASGFLTPLTLGKAQRQAVAAPGGCLTPSLSTDGHYCAGLCWAAHMPQDRGLGLRHAPSGVPSSRVPSGRPGCRARWARAGQRCSCQSSGVAFQGEEAGAAGRGLTWCRASTTRTTS